MHFFVPLRLRKSPFITALLGILLLAGCASAPSPTPPSPPPATNAGTLPSTQSSGDAADLAHQQAFDAWVSAFRATARSAGIGESTLADALGNVRFVPRVIELDRVQPEFTRTVWDYLDRTVTPQRVAMGQDKLRQVRTEAAAVAQQQAVPLEVVVAIWGMESNYGSNVGDIPTIDALATLGFEGRRTDWARNELLAALKILERRDITRERMIGSWAGAMGQTQFLPSSFLAYAVDGDADGRRDIWGSLPDVVASTANYLSRSGWQAQQPWGLEVRLPAGFDYARADASTTQSTAQWAAEGVTTMDGAPMPAIAEAYVLLPAGARGPAFLVGPNFRAILRYNNSTSYALAVGLLSQQIAGGVGVQTAWPRDLAALSRSDTSELQRALNERGFASGAPDGMMGPATRAAVRAYQRSAGLPADGYPSTELLQRLRRP